MFLKIDGLNNNLWIDFGQLPVLPFSEILDIYHKTGWIMVSSKLPDQSEIKEISFDEFLKTKGYE